MQHAEQVPEAGVQDGVAARDVEVGQALHAPTHVLYGRYDRHASLPRHFN
jgi:hypothetical protein